MNPDTRRPSELARQAIADAKVRLKDRTAGATVWRKREPILAEALLAALGIPKSQSEDAYLRGKLRIANEEIGRLQGELRDARFERDRAVIAHNDAVDVARKLVADYVSAEYLDAPITQRLANLEALP